MILLCPNCHKEYDKIYLYHPDQVRNWKKIREEELDQLFYKECSTFADLQKEVVPLLMENKVIYENYYLDANKELWDIFEIKILINNNKLKKLFERNLNLFQRHSWDYFSNLEIIHKFILHVYEFENTRLSEEKNRQLLFPKEINSMFGIEPVFASFMPTTETLEELITKLNEEGRFISIVIGDELPCLTFNENGNRSVVFLEDTPRLRQLFYNYHCKLRSKVRFESLNFALRYIKRCGVPFDFLHYNNLREIRVYGVKMIFIYEYCFSRVQLSQMLPERNTVIVNLHNWNGSGCISSEARAFAKKMGVILFSMEEFYAYIKEKRDQG